MAKKQPEDRTIRWSRDAATGFYLGKFSRKVVLSAWKGGDGYYWTRISDDGEFWPHVGPFGDMQAACDNATDKFLESASAA